MDRAFDRRRFLRVGAGLATGLAIGLATPWARVAGAGVDTRTDPGAPASGPPVPPGQLRLLTSPDHWDRGRPARRWRRSVGVAVRITPLTDDAGAFADVSQRRRRRGHRQRRRTLDPAYHAAGLTEPHRPQPASSVAQELYPVARTMDLLADPGRDAGLPLELVAAPDRVRPRAGRRAHPIRGTCSSTPAHRGRVVIEEQQMDLVLCAAVAIGAADPLDMTDAELAAATDWLTRLKPNIRRIVHHRGDAIDALASGECSMAISSLGAPDLVKDAGGPEVVAFVPKEGTIGSIEAEMVPTGAANAARVPAYLDAAASAEASAAAFLSDGRPLFNERAYRLLVDARPWRPGPSLPVRPARGRAGDDAHRARRPTRRLPGGGPGRLR